MSQARGDEPVSTQVDKVTEEWGEGDVSWGQSFSLGGWRALEMDGEVVAAQHEGTECHPAGH